MAAYEGFAELETKGWSDDTISSGYVNMFAEASDMAIPHIVSNVEGEACQRRSGKRISPKLSFMHGAAIGRFEPSAAPEVSAGHYKLCHALW